jgi:transcriptional regulator with XRE-family HTH domain
MKPVSERHPVDLYVGRRLRSFRLAAGMGQADLAAVVGVTFQQIQKYETGGNRISASKLYEIANALGTDIGAFFEGYRHSTMAPADG